MTDKEKAACNAADAIAKEQGWDDILAETTWVGKRRKLAEHLYYDVLMEGKQSI
jgi:hypothetical protein